MHTRFVLNSPSSLSPNNKREKAKYSGSATYDIRSVHKEEEKGVYHSKHENQCRTNFGRRPFPPEVRKCFDFSKKYPEKVLAPSSPPPIYSLLVAI